MDESKIRAALEHVPLSGLRLYESIGSTNDDALAWAVAGAQDLSLVIADEQTSGRGRSGRKWFTPPKAALAFSLILRPRGSSCAHPARITGLGALALVETCMGLGLKAQIKWPNDVLIGGRKVAGILVETPWTGDQIEAHILGMGVNVRAASIPPANELLFPATCIENELGHSIDRLALLKEILTGIIKWRTKLDGDEFIEAWNQVLAFRGEYVQVSREHEPPLAGRLLGLELDGSLRLMEYGKPITVPFGEIRLRPTNDRIP